MFKNITPKPENIRTFWNCITIEARPLAFEAAGIPDFLYPSPGRRAFNVVITSYDNGAQFVSDEQFTHWEIASMAADFTNWLDIHCLLDPRALLPMGDYEARYWAFIEECLLDGVQPLDVDPLIEDRLVQRGLIAIGRWGDYHLTAQAEAWA